MLVAVLHVGGTGQAAQRRLRGGRHYSNLTATASGEAVMPRDGPGQALSYISIAGLHPAVEFTRARTQVKVETMTSGQIESRRHARKDPPDARDRHFVPTRKIPSRVEITAYRPHAGPVLKQGFENTCTGEALAAVANYLLRRHRRAGAPGPVSSRMLYEMAKHFDEMRGFGP
jgi:hypothetical protein